MANMLLKILVDNTAVNSGIATVQNSVSAFKNQVNSSFKEMGKNIAGMLGGAAIIGGIKTILSKADQLSDMSKKFGISAETLQKLGMVAQNECDGSMESLAKALNKLAINSQEATSGNKMMIETFAQAGISVDELRGKSPEEIFFMLSDAMKDGVLKGQEFAVTQALLGKGSTDLIPLMEQGSEAIKSMANEYDAMSNSTVNSLGKANDTLENAMNTIMVWAATGLQFLGNIVSSIMANYAFVYDVFTKGWKEAKQVWKDTQKEIWNPTQNTLKQRTVSGTDKSEEIQREKERKKEEKEIEKLFEKKKSLNEKLAELDRSTEESKQNILNNVKSLEEKIQTLKEGTIEFEKTQNELLEQRIELKKLENEKEKQMQSLREQNKKRGEKQLESVFTESDWKAELKRLDEENKKLKEQYDTTKSDAEKEVILSKRFDVQEKMEDVKDRLANIDEDKIRTKIDNLKNKKDELSERLTPSVNIDSLRSIGGSMSGVNYGALGGILTSQTNEEKQIKELEDQTKLLEKQLDALKKLPQAENSTTTRITD